VNAHFRGVCLYRLLEARDMVAPALLTTAGVSVTATTLVTPYTVDDRVTATCHVQQPEPNTVGPPVLERAGSPAIEP